jgi:hypothetical protein
MQVHHGAVAVATPIITDTANASRVQLTNPSTLAITRPPSIVTRLPAFNVEAFTLTPLR